MWYFAWLLGLGLACSFGVLNAMWYEMHLATDGDQGTSQEAARNGNDGAGVAEAA